MRYMILVVALAVVGCAKREPSSKAEPERRAVKTAEEIKEERKAKADAKKAEREQAKATAKEAKRDKLQRIVPKNGVGILISDYLDEWRDNNIKAEKFYKGCLVPIVGTIGKVSYSLMGTPQVTLKSDSLLDIVVCQFDRDDVKKLEELTTDKAIIIEGRCVGMHLLDQCKIVRVGK